MPFQNPNYLCHEGAIIIRFYRDRVTIPPECEVRIEGRTITIPGKGYCVVKDEELDRFQFRSNDRPFVHQRSEVRAIFDHERNPIWVNPKLLQHLAP